MLALGHLGITMGIVKSSENILPFKGNDKNKYIDYRLVMLGSLLPDTIDKPLGVIIYGFANHPGRLIAHSYLFSAALIILGLSFYILMTNKTIIILGICSLLHQIFDSLMFLPNYFSLPTLDKVSAAAGHKLDLLHGIMISIYRVIPYLKDVNLYLSEPNVYISEILGFFILEYFFWKLILNKRFSAFLKKGIL